MGWEESHPISMRRMSGLLSTCLGVAGSVALSGALLNPQAGLAQSAVPYSAVRAINLARNVAIQQNGGLSVYRPAQCMYETANAFNRCLIGSPGENNSNAQGNRGGNNNQTNDAWVFRFQGGGPGWQQMNQRPTVETEISISADGRNVLQVIYNGSPR